ncbi:glycosyltransferase family 2 protein [Paenibacillus sp. GYB003]|uniref:glycosyltransferase family 2 protein n=1 Tax=Paenibacillus sp. GYB003 TaxID=2994392 RepID=UPI002F96C0F3
MKVSVVMAVYNGERYVKQSIDSVLAQSYRDFELIVVNDGSTDRTMDIVGRMSDPRLKVVSLPRNGGAASALNTAVRHSSGDWIAIHDADDVSLPERLAVQAEYARTRPQLSAVGAQIACFGEAGVSPQRLRETEKALNLSGPTLFRDRYSICPLCHGTALISKAKFWQAGGYDTGYTITYDYDLWLKLFRLGPIEKIDRVLYRYRLRPDSLSHNGIHTYVERLRCCVRRLCEFDLPRRAGVPDVVVLGEEKHCRTMRAAVAPYCPIRVRLYCHSRIGAMKEKLVSMATSGEISGILQLGHGMRKELTLYFEQRGLVRNRQFFNL